MATIKINFDEKSIKNAIIELNKVQQKLYTTVPKRFLTLCSNWIINRANERIRDLDIGSEVKEDIISRWRVSNLSNNRIKVINDSNKAVFVEFGVGKIGKESPHPQSSSEGYEYNKDSGKKDRYGQWRFTLENKDQIDLIADYYSKNENTITTKGSPANLYLYNSLMDLISSGIYKLLWQQALLETI